MSEELYAQMKQTVIDGEVEDDEALKAADPRDSVKVMSGGAPTTRAWADEIGADGYAENAIEAVTTAKSILGVGAAS